MLLVNATVRKEAVTSHTAETGLKENALHVLLRGVAIVVVTRIWVACAAVPDPGSLSDYARMTEVAQLSVSARRSKPATDSEPITIVTFELRPAWTSRGIEEPDSVQT